MSTDITIAVEAAGQQADLLAQQIGAHNGDLAVAFHALEERVREFETVSGQDASVLMPADDDAGLRFLRNRAGADFWIAYRKRIRNQLCNPRGALRKLAKDRASWTGTTIVTALVGTLNLPLELIPVFGPIVAILMTTGLDAFCDQSVGDARGTS